MFQMAKGVFQATHFLQSGASCDAGQHKFQTSTFSADDMNISIEVKSSLIMAAIQDDRVEIRTIKDRIYSNITFITVASFAVTSFLIGKDALTTFSYMLPTIDVSFLAMLWIVFWRQKIDIDVCHLCLENREEMLRNLALEEQPFDVFGAVPWGTKPKINENGLYWSVSIATFALVIKMVVILIAEH